MSLTVRNISQNIVSPQNTAMGLNNYMRTSSSRLVMKRLFRPKAVEKGKKSHKHNFDLTSL
jgi:hypothetical protein